MSLCSHRRRSSAFRAAVDVTVCGGCGRAGAPAAPSHYLGLSTFYVSQSCPPPPR